MDYIETVLGVRVRYKAWNHEAETPYYLLDRYEFCLAEIGTVRAIFLYPKTELDQLGSLRKQIVRIQKLEALPVVLIMKNVNRYRRESLISARIPFVVPYKQLYLPFMGIVLQEQFDVGIPHTEKLQPSAQVLFFYYLYQREKRLYMNKAIKMLGFSAMTITRAVRQLEETRLFFTQKEGVQKILVGNYEERELFDQMSPYLISPVRKTVYIGKSTKLSDMYVAGLSALADKSILNPPNVMCYAVSGKKIEMKGTETLIDAETQAAVEIWKYDPGILGQNGIVDTLSLVMALKNYEDERVEDAVEEVLNRMWRN